MTREVSRTEDGRWLVVDGRRWRPTRRCPTTSVPGYCTTSASRALAVGSAGRAGDDAALAAARHRVQPAKTGWGERGTE